MIHGDHMEIPMNQPVDMGLSCQLRKRVPKIHTRPKKLTNRTWKTGVGRGVFFWGRPIFRGEVLVSGRVKFLHNEECIERTNMFLWAHAPVCFCFSPCFRICVFALKIAMFWVNDVVTSPQKGSWRRGNSIPFISTKSPISNSAILDQIYGNFGEF